MTQARSTALPGELKKLVARAVATRLPVDPRILLATLWRLHKRGTSLEELEAAIDGVATGQGEAAEARMKARPFAWVLNTPELRARYAQEGRRRLVLPPETRTILRRLVCGGPEGAPLQRDTPETAESPAPEGTARIGDVATARVVAVTCTIPDDVRAQAVRIGLLPGLSMSGDLSGVPIEVRRQIEELSRLHKEEHS